MHVSLRQGRLCKFTHARPHRHDAGPQRFEPATMGTPYRPTCTQVGASAHYPATLTRYRICHLLFTMSIDVCYSLSLLLIGIHYPTCCLLLINLYVVCYSISAWPLNILLILLVICLTLLEGATKAPPNSNNNPGPQPRNRQTLTITQAQTLNLPVPQHNKQCPPEGGHL
jgi:hypothetical protein